MSEERRQAAERCFTGRDPLVTWPENFVRRIEAAMAEREAPLREEIRRLRATLERVRQGYRNILAFRRVYHVGTGDKRYGNLTREEIEGVIAEIDDALNPQPQAEAPMVDCMACACTSTIPLDHHPRCAKSMLRKPQAEVPAPDAGPTGAQLTPFAYRLPKPHMHIEVARTSIDPTWYICKGRGAGTSADYWRDGDGWVYSTPSRYETPQDAARAFLAAPQETRRGE